MNAPPSLGLLEGQPAMLAKQPVLGAVSLLSE
jgi:hypothetical protein